MFDKVFTQDDLDSIEQEFINLEPVLSFYCSKKEEQIQNRLKKLLFEEEEIINKHILSTSKHERKELYMQFLEKESMLHSEYERLPSKYSTNKDISLKHGLNSMNYDFKILCNKILNNKVVSAIGFALLGVIFCIPYFFIIQKVPEIPIGDIPLSLVMISVIGIFFAIVIFFYMLIQNLFLFKAWYSVDSSKRLMFIFVNTIFIVFMALIPFIKVYFEIQLDINDLLNRVLWFFVSFLFLSYLFFWLHDRKEIESNLMSFAMNFFSDLTILTIIYLNYNSDYLILIIFIVLLHIFIRLLQSSNNFPYWVSIFFISIITIIFLMLSSGFFVRAVGLANYQTDFTINKKDIPQYIKNLKIPKCSDIEIKKDKIVFQKHTCIIDENEKEIAFQHILVKVKSDSRYWLELILENIRGVKKDFWMLENKIVN